MASDPDEYHVGVLTPEDAEDMARYPDDVKELILQTDAKVREDFRHYTEDYTHTIETTADGDKFVQNYDNAGNPVSGWHGPITSLFGLSYASWLVLPRVTLQEMPLKWQARFAALLDEAEEMGVLHRPVTHVTVVGDDGKYQESRHWNNYRRGSVVQALAADRAINDAREQKREKKRKEALNKTIERIAAKNMCALDS